MAKLVEGILGGFSGRVGTVVGYHRRGRWFVRAYQPHIHDRRSEAQLQQRSRFRAMIRFASPATPVLRAGLCAAARRLVLTEGNVFLKINKMCFAQGQGAAVEVDYARLRFSSGSLPGVRLEVATVDGSGVLAVRWTSLGGVGGDRVVLYVYSEAMATGIAAEGRRDGGGVRLLLPDGFPSGVLHVWAFAVARGGEVSARSYLAASDTDVLEAADLQLEEGSFESRLADVQNESLRAFQQPVETFFSLERKKCVNLHPN